MKKNLLLLAAVGGMLMAANQSNAQEVVVAEEVATITTQNVECKDHFIHDWHKNWFIQVGAGAHLPFVEDTRFGHHWYKQVTAYYNVGFGHWWSPYFGFRFTGFYGANHWDPNSVQGYGNDTWSKSKNVNVNLEVMWDMINSIRGYNPTRVFSIIPFIGIGGAYTWDQEGVNELYTYHGDKKTNNWTLPVSAGIQLRFRLCKYVDFFAEGRFQFYPDTWNFWAINRPFDIDAVAIGGFNFNLGGREFASYNPCEYLDYINQLNNQVNDLRGALATTAAALAAAEAQLPCPEVTPAPVETQRKPAPMLSCVRFKIDSSVVTDQEMINVWNVAEYMKANPDCKINIQGYADRDTGTPGYNMKLSERRTQSVYDILTKKYGVDGSRLIRKHFGSDVQPFEVNNWNRVVIFVE